jgi:uncharacterized protein YjbJ (UPF0337 family)
MNEDILKGNWKKMTGNMRQWLVKLTDDELEQIAGKSDELAGLLQERYGYTKEEAHREIERRFAESDRI